MSGTIQTASLQELDSFVEKKKRGENFYLVLVTRSWPKGFRGLKDKIDAWLPELGPSIELLREVEKEAKILKEPRRVWNLTHFDSRFRVQILNDSLALTLLRGLALNSASGKNVVLFCFEKDDSFCHRRILKEIMERLF